MKRLSVLSWATGALLLAVSMVATARGDDVYKGVVVYVDDGDTVVLLADGNEQIKVRLASIDAPESSHTKKEAGRVGQPFSENSKRFLSDMVKGKTVEAVCPDTDRYGRKVCELRLNGVSANAEMVRDNNRWIK